VALNPQLNIINPNSVTNKTRNTQRRDKRKKEKEKEKRTEEGSKWTKRKFRQGRENNGTALHRHRGPLAPDHGAIHRYPSSSVGGIAGGETMDPESIPFEVMERCSEKLPELP